MTAAFTSDSSARVQRSIVAVLAHADDEGPVAPLLARYAREGVQVYMVVVTDGSAGGQHSRISGFDRALTNAELATVRADEARCAAHALGAQPPILLGFPDGRLGDYLGDRGLTYRATERIAEELKQLQPDVVITWGPEGGTGHPDHRMVSSIVTQLQRTGAPAVPERLFYMSVPIDFWRALSRQRGAPPLMLPHDKYFTTHVSFAAEDFRAAKRAMACHRTQFTSEVVERVSAATAVAWNGGIPLIPAFAGASATSLF